MLTPPPVSGEAYATAVGVETRSNYLRGGLIVTTSYNDNVLGDLARQVGDVGYSIFPTIAIDKTTPRLHYTLTYAPGFTAYQNTSSLDQTNQNVSLNFQYRLSPHLTLALRDSLQKASSLFNQPDSLSEGTVSGSPQPPLVTVIAPVGDYLGNAATAELTYQFNRNSMIGANGGFTILDYSPSPTGEFTLQSSNSSGGSAFYSHRLSRNDYIGVTYQYLGILTYPVSRQTAYPVNAKTETQTNTVFLFYTIYLNPTFSLSFSGGPQRFDVVQLPLPVYGSWSPALTASAGRQGPHTNFAVSYSRAITGGGGLVGAFQSNSAGAYARWRFARSWYVGSDAGYRNYKSVTPSAFLSTNGGHTLYGTVSAQHQLSEHLNVEFRYTRAHQTYSGIPVISIAPDTNREFISFSYTFMRPLGG